uniref:Uncharacterized protein n=1 Tax=Cacopsylla melanoneura TaxID=428564 RepID=A0A8D8QMR0_9HEMI
MVKLLSPGVNFFFEKEMFVSFVWLCKDQIRGPSLNFGNTIGKYPFTLFHIVLESSFGSSPYFVHISDILTCKIYAFGVNLMKTFYKRLVGDTITFVLQNYVQQSVLSCMF